MKMHKWIFLIALLTSALANEINSQNSVLQLQESLKPQETEHNIKEDYIKKRNQMINKDRSSHFTVDVKELTTEEKMVEQRLFGIRDAMLADNSPLLMEVHDAIVVMKTSKLFDVLKDMPKGAHLHFHIEGGMRPDELLEMTKEDFVYYSVKDGMLKTAPGGLQAEGYVRCNELRKNWNSTESFDEFLMRSLSLNRTDTMTKKSEIIWENFEKKFKLFGGLVHYHKFYKIILEKTIRKAIADGVKVLEVRRSLGRIFNDNCGKVYNQTVDMKSGTACIDAPSEMLSIKEELEIYREIINKIKLDEPEFELFIIASSFKVFGHQHALTQISYYKYAIENGYSFVVGFDLVNEEDKYEPILFFTDELLDAKIKLKNIEYFFHTGESANRYNENLYDSVLLKAKRIGHSIPLTHHPYLMQLVKTYNIGIEICPISNWMLGYIHDPRWHPARQMIASKISITINSDIHTFFNHDALTTDFALAFLSWDLDLKDLKQLAINSIMYSSLLESRKYHHLLLFEKQWNVFITSFLKSQ